MFIFQFWDDNMHNHVLFNAFVRFTIQKLKNKHTFLKTPRELSFLSFEESMFIFLFFNDKILSYVFFDIIVHFIIQKLKNKHTFLKKYRN